MHFLDASGGARSAGAGKSRSDGQWAASVGPVHKAAPSPIVSAPMKSLPSHPGLLRFAALGALLGLGAVPVQALERPGTPPTLKVEVTTPPSWNLLVSDDVATWFVDGVRSVLHRYGYDGEVEELRYPDDPRQFPHRVSLYVSEWRMNRIGHIDCTLIASVHTPQGEKRLGIYTHSLPRWLGGFGRDGLRRAFEEAADQAILDLCRDLVRSELIPGLRAHAA